MIENNKNLCLQQLINEKFCFNIQCYFLDEKVLLLKYDLKFVISYIGNLNLVLIKMMEFVVILELNNNYDNFGFKVDDEDGDEIKFVKKLDVMVIDIEVNDIIVMLLIQKIVELFGVYGIDEDG